MKTPPVKTAFEKHVPHLQRQLFIAQFVKAQVQRFAEHDAKPKLRIVK